MKDRLWLVLQVGGVLAALAFNILPAGAAQAGMNPTIMCSDPAEGSTLLSCNIAWDDVAEDYSWTLTRGSDGSQIVGSGGSRVMYHTHGFAILDATDVFGTEVRFRVVGFIGSRQSHSSTVTYTLPEAHVPPATTTTTTTTLPPPELNVQFSCLPALSVAATFSCTAQWDAVPDALYWVFVRDSPSRARTYYASDDGQTATVLQIQVPQSAAADPDVPNSGGVEVQVLAFGPLPDYVLLGDETQDFTFPFPFVPPTTTTIAPVEHGHGWDCQYFYAGEIIERVHCESDPSEIPLTDQVLEGEGIARGRRAVNTGDAIIIGLLAMLVVFEARRLFLSWYDQGFFGLGGKGRSR